MQTKTHYGLSPLIFNCSLYRSNLNSACVFLLLCKPSDETLSMGETLTVSKDVSYKGE